MPYKILWLGGLGCALVAAIAMGSAIKTETGWGGLGAVEICKLRVN
ncbi:hypothetical protein QUB37_20240 [Microcoleus sp. AT3-A2]